MVFGSLASFALAYRLQQQRQRSQQTTSSHTNSNHHLYAEDEAQHLLSHEEINKCLSKNERAVLVKNNLLRRVDTNSYAANDPIEDRNIEDYGEESFLGVFDGHAGDGCAQFLTDHLIPYMKFRLGMRTNVRKQMKEKQPYVNNLEIETMTDQAWELEINNASDEKQRKILTDMRNIVKYNYGIPLVIKESFIYTDSVFCKGALVRMIKGRQLLPNDLSGACAILAYIQKNQLWVANTGDCRAIMARRDPITNELVALPLSSDQTAESEEKRLRSEFPNEPDIVFDGRIKGGLQPSRSFGDIMYKEPVIGILLPDLVKHQEVWNPPYVKSEPEIYHTEIDPRHDQFIVIASDGLWDVFSNTEVVNLVDQHRKEHDTENVSTFLIKQALLKSGYGKNETEKLSNLLQLPTEFKRMLHDDITVQVAFFNSEYQSVPFEELEKREEVPISPLYVEVLKDFSELISQDHKL